MGKTIKNAGYDGLKKIRPVKKSKRDRFVAEDYDEDTVDDYLWEHNQCDTDTDTDDN